MARSPPSSHLISAAVLALTSAPAALGQASFQGLGFLAGLEEQSFAYAVSADGSTVVGYSGGFFAQAFRWRRETGMVSLGHLPAPYDGFSVAYAVSADGSVVVGEDTNYHTETWPTEGFTWTQSAGIVPLGVPAPFGTNESSARSISADGSVIVGFWGSRACQWTPLGLETLTPLYGHAAGVSADGRVIVGTFNNSGAIAAMRWTRASGPVDIGHLPGVPPSSYAPAALAVSSDGFTIVGASQSGNAQAFDVEAFRWTAATGMIGIGDLPGGVFHSIALATSGDGSIIVGLGSTGEALPDGFIWTANTGMRSLREFLQQEHGVDLTGWVSVQGIGISCDGRSIVGAGMNPQVRGEAFLAYLGPCPGDFNRSSSINSQDFFDYLTAFFSGSMSADINHSGDVTSQDFFDFLAAFFAGCP